MARTPNRRGEGARLRAEIVAAATRLLERTGSEDAATLRAIAREAGIAAPSIYGHFANREAVLDAVVAHAFVELHAALLQAASQEPDPLGRVHAVCRAYLDFAETRPHRYRVLFERSRGSDSAPSKAAPLDQLSGATSFGVLAEAVAALAEVAGSSPGRDEIMRDATALWVAVHGYASLRANVPAFPWPDRDHFLSTLVERLVTPGRKL